MYVWTENPNLKSFHITCLDTTSAYLKSRSMCLFDEKLEFWSSASSSGVDTCIVSLSRDLASDLSGRLAVEYSSLEQKVNVNQHPIIRYIHSRIYFTYSLTLCWLVSTSIGDPPSPGPMDASLESTLIDKGLTTFLKFQLRGTIGVELLSWHIDR